MERKTYGRQSNAHGSTHRELTANADPSRKIGRPRRKTHDDEASASGLRA
jgi:hypothetical protein